MPTVQQLAAKLNRNAINQLKREVQAMPADKQTWQPLDQGRTALNQAAECAVAAGLTVTTLNSRQLPPMEHDTFSKAIAELDSLDKTLAALDANGEALAAAIEAFPTEELDNTIQLPWLPEPWSFAQIMLLPYWNTVYHIGQISYIQTLYGDKEMH